MLEKNSLISCHPVSSHSSTVRLRSSLSLRVIYLCEVVIKLAPSVRPYIAVRGIRERSGGGGSVTTNHESESPLSPPRLGTFPPSLADSSQAAVAELEYCPNLAAPSECCCLCLRSLRNGNESFRKWRITRTAAAASAPPPKSSF